MMSQGEYLQLLYKLVESRSYSYVDQVGCKIMFVGSKSNVTLPINRIEDKVFIGLKEYYTDRKSTFPDGFLKVLDKFTNGAMLVEFLPASTN